jgi:predicted Rossmann fold nucleotide-binding protein DprA/Smf involved in DNA uptake
VEVLEQLDGASALVRGALAAAGHGGAAAGAATGSCGAGDVTSAQARLLAALDAGEAPLGVDELSAKTGLPVGRIVADLTLLQIRGRVRRVGEGFRNRSCAS